MGAAFVRQLGAESGVQLNPLVDNSEIPSFDLSDQIFGIVMRSTRGRIDRPFKVNRGNVTSKLGIGEQIRVTELNEAYVQVREALNNGAYEAVVQRLVNGTSSIKYSYIAMPEVVQVIKFPNWMEAAIRYELTWSDPLVPEAGKYRYLTSDTLPNAEYLFAIKHFDCFNDGIKIEYRADELRVRDVLMPNPFITLRLLDKDNVVLHEFYGSLSQDARDDYGNSLYLPDVITEATDSIEIEIGVTGFDAVIPTNSVAYGYDNNGDEKWHRSGLMICFIEGSHDYTQDEIIAACKKLQSTQHGYAYIASGGSRSFTLLRQLAKLAYDTNKQLRFDVPGNLSVRDAISFVDDLDISNDKGAHLMHAYWSPFKSSDPTGIQGKQFFGTSALNIAYSCIRNSQYNSLGFAPKNYPIAGRLWPVNRNGIIQTVMPTDQELNALAKAKINPVIYEVYSNGGRTVFRDSLTLAQVDSSLKKLISVAEMSTSVDDAVTRFGKDCLQLPMSIGLLRFADFLKTYFNDAEASGWFVTSESPEMGGKAWTFDVRPNAMRPYDRIDVNYAIRYDGTVRQIIVTQTLSK